MSEKDEPPVFSPSEVFLCDWVCVLFGKTLLEISAAAIRLISSARSMKSLVLALDYISFEGCVLELGQTRVALTEDTSPYSPITSSPRTCSKGPKWLGQSSKLPSGLCHGDALTSFAGGLNFQCSFPNAVSSFTRFPQGPFK